MPNANLGPDVALAKRLSTIERNLASLSSYALRQVANSVNADASAYAFNNVVSGTTTYAVWVGNDGTFHLGRATSSIRYKTNVREHYTNPANLLALTPVVFDRKDGSTKDEFGLIAEQVAEHFPELVTWFDGQIDGVRYDLLAVALLSVVKEQDARLKALEDVAAFVRPGFLRGLIKDIADHAKAPSAPHKPHPPLPFTIHPHNSVEALAGLGGSGSLSAL
jgi:hypothetical protein